jgi:hypothetical protein
LSRHGYGHLVRTAEVLRVLAAERPLRLTVHSDLPSSLWPSDLHGSTDWVDEAWDAGVVQSDDLHVDRAATAERLASWADEEDAVLGRVVERLRGRVDLVLGDVPPLAFRAAERLGVPGLALANFSWDWIYREMGFEDAAARAERAYMLADDLYRLDPSTPMPAFRRCSEVGLLGRRSRMIRHHSRARLGLRPEQRLVLVAFRSAGSGLVELPAPEFDLFYLLPTSRSDLAGRRDCLLTPQDIDWIELVAACDVVVSKPGYGILGDTAGTGTPLLFASRQGFPEDRFLEDRLAERATARRVRADALASGCWFEDLEAILQLERPEPEETPAAARIVRDILARFP